MRIKIRDWDDHFEADRSRQWKSLKWVPIPNKQGLGYKKIMLQKNGAEIFGCWNAIVQQGSLCSPRGDLSKYSISDLSLNTMIPLDVLTNNINFIVQNLDWIEVVENLDINVNESDKNVSEPAVGSSILCSSMLSNSVQEGVPGEKVEKPKKKKAYIFICPDHLADVWPKYVEMRDKIKKPLTDEAKRLAIEKLNNLSIKHDVQIKIIEQSIFNSWQGLFELKSDFENKTPAGRKLNEYEIGAASKYDGM